MRAPARLLLVVLSLAVPAARAETGGERSLAIYPPQRIPVAFDHGEHLKGGADCLTCHDRARKSTRASDRNLPGHAECEACHDIKKAAAGKKVDPPSACRVCHPGFDQTARKAPALIDAPTPNLIFDHQVHVQRKVECTTCHGSMDEVRISTRAQLPKMAVCLSCHDGARAPSDCTTCHLAEPSGRLRLEFPSGTLEPTAGNPLGLDHGPAFERAHATRATTSRSTCLSCHAERECQDCHDSLHKPISVHPNDYVALHPVQARANATWCESCHRLQSFCTACHDRLGVGLEADATLHATSVRVHPDYATWVTNPGPRHHGVEASRDLPSCIACHREETCVQCHADADKGAGRGYVVSPHPDGFKAVCAAAAARDDRPCLKCHAESALVSLRCR